jgi:hypothetical protein
LDRGTAGVDDRVILSIVNGLPTVTGLPDLVNVPLENPITQADLANIGVQGSFTAPAIGPLNSNQVQGLLAQIANYVDQPADVMTDSTGVGQYGLSCQQLEQAGYVKPGTYREFIFDPSPLTAVLSAPGIWTGRNGVTEAAGFLRNPALQNDAMTTLLKTSYNSLTAVGTIATPITSSVTALAGQVYTQSGLQTVSQLSAATGVTLPTSLTNFGSISPAISSLVSSPISAIGSLSSGAVNNLISGASSNISSVVSNLTNTVTGGVSALVSIGGIFGTSAATQWAKSGSIDQLISGGGIAGNQAFGTLTSSLPGLATSLTNNISGLDVLGKASQFASSFSNPLSSLSNLGNFNLSNLTSGLPSLGNLTSGLTSNLTGAVSGLANNVTGAVSNLAGNLGNLGNLADLGNLGNLGDLGGLFGGGGDALVSGTKVAAGYSNTVNRATVDVAFAKILGSNKIPKPVFDLPSPNSISLNAGLDISFAQNALKNLQSGASNLLGAAQNALGSSLGGITSQVNNLASTATNAVRAIV